jgi:hypothetical protein
LVSFVSFFCRAGYSSPGGQRLCIESCFLSFRVVLCSETFGVRGQAEDSHLVGQRLWPSLVSRLVSRLLLVRRL